MGRRATPLWERTFGRFLATLKTEDLQPMRTAYDRAIARNADDKTLLHNLTRRRELLDAETTNRGQHLG